MLMHYHHTCVFYIRDMQRNNTNIFIHIHVKFNTHKKETMKNYIMIISVFLNILSLFCIRNFLLECLKQKLIIYLCIESLMFYSNSIIYNVKVYLYTCMTQNIYSMATCKICPNMHINITIRIVIFIHYSSVCIMVLVFKENSPLCFQLHPITSAIIIIIFSCDCLLYIVQREVPAPRIELIPNCNHVSAMPARVYAGELISRSIELLNWYNVRTLCAYECCITFGLLFCAFSSKTTLIVSQFIYNN